MHNRLIDLFSDTATRPSPGMRKAMAEAEVGDEQRGEDPTTKALESRVATLLGKEAAVFLPSGTMCNQIAIAVHCSAGDEIIAADKSHIFNYEAGGSSVTARAHSWPIKTVNGIFSGADVEALVRPPAIRHHPRTRLVSIEQTQNIGGGAVWTLAEMAEVAAAARKHNLALHMDGARLLNAVVASGVSAKSMAEHCDSVWLDLSKGLGCPIGGVLAGSKDFIDQCWRWKHRLGGAMRQSGIVAAAGLYALEHNIDRLVDDHAHAKHLATVFAETKGIRLKFDKIETNLVFLDVSASGRTAHDISAALMKRGVRIGAMAPTLLRAVTHLDVSRDDIETTCKIWREEMS
jgi:threonine aldolase